MPKINLSFNISSLDKFFVMDGIVNPKRDWTILTIIFATIVIASVTFDIFIYTQIVDGDMYVSVNKNELTIETLKTAQLKALVDEFQIRQTQVGNIKPKSVIDPSI